jgi:integrase
LSLPLLDDVGWAIIDYIRGGRPETACPKVFVKHRHPFDTFGCASSVASRLSRHAARAGIEFGPDEVCGMHSLRGALAVAMIGNGAPIPVVSAVLGHACSDTTQAYYLRFESNGCGAARWTSKTSSNWRGRVSAVPETTLPDLVADLVASRHAGGYRFTVQERVLRQFADHCRREAYPDGSITKEAVEGFLYGHHLRSSTIRRNELVLRQLAEHAKGIGWQVYTPAARTRVRVRHQPPYVLTDEEVRRLFAAIDSQAMSSYSNKALVDPVLFRVLYGAGLRVSEALNLRLPDVDTHAGTLRIREAKNGERRTVPITSRLAATMDAYVVAAHPVPEHSDYLFYSRGARRPINQATVYTRFRS